MTRPLFDRIRRNGTFKILGEVGGRGLGFLYIALLARWVGDENFGRYSFALSFSLLFAVLIDCGANSLLIRDLARHRDEVSGIVSRSSGLRLLGVATTWIAVLLLHYLISPDQPGRELVPVLVLFVVGTGILEYFAAVFCGLERMGMEAILRVTNRALCLMGAFVGHTIGGGLMPTVLGMLAGFAVSLILALGMLRHAHVPLMVRLDRGWCRGTVRDSLPLFGTLSLWKLYENQGVVLLTLLGTPLREVGWYGAAIRLIDMLRSVPALLAGSVFPVLAESVVTDRPSYLRVARFALQSALVVALPLAVGTVLLADPIVHVIYSEEYAPASRLLAILIIAIIGIFLNGVMTSLLIASDQQRHTTPGAVFVTVCNLVLLLVLVPRHGGTGAAWALVVSETAYIVYNCVLVQHRLRIWDRSFLGYVWRPGLATAAMGGTLTVLPQSFSLFAVVPLGALAYGLALLILRGIPDRK